MIIAEGPDGGGKTSLVKVIADEMGFEARRSPHLEHKKQPGKEHVEWWHEQLEARQSDRLNVVYDRCFMLSEPIYSLAMQRTPLVQPGEYSQMLDMFFENKPLIIFCLPPWHTIKEYVAKTKEEQLTGLSEKRLLQVYWQYNALATLCELLEEYGEACTVLRWDFTAQDGGYFYPAVRRWISERASKLGVPVDA